MVIQHNLTALNANRNLNTVTGKQKKDTEKLSSGYKINRAADDAAGLSISEKMRRQIRGLSQASLNEMWVHSPPLGAQANFNRTEKHDTM